MLSVSVSSDRLASLAQPGGRRTNPSPYDLPIFRRAHTATAPDGSDVATIDPAYEVSMSNPTMGTLRLSSGLDLEGCNPSFIWSDDSRYLAVPIYFRRFGLFRRQRLAIVDTVEQRVVASPETACYFQPESFTEGILVVVKEPFGSAKRVRWSIPGQFQRFKEVAVNWAGTPGRPT